MTLSWEVVSGHPIGSDGNVGEDEQALLFLPCIMSATQPGLQPLSRFVSKLYMKAWPATSPGVSCTDRNFLVQPDIGKDTVTKQGSESRERVVCLGHYSHREYNTSTSAR